MPRPSKLYLAYGSNLHRAQMRRRCPQAKALGSVMLTNAKLLFRGVADVIYAPGQQVPCGVWRIYREDEAALDRYEGVCGGHYNKEMVELDDGHEAMLYVMSRKGIYPPSQYYYDIVRQGYMDFGLDLGYLNNALMQSYLKKNPTDYTEARRARQRNGNQRKLAKMPDGIADKVQERIARLAMEQDT